MFSPCLCSIGKSKMPVGKDRVGDETVDVLRDTGCSGVVLLKRNLCLRTSTLVILTACCSSTIQYERYSVPIARVSVDRPYFTGKVGLQCLPDAISIYNLIIAVMSKVPGLWITQIQADRKPVQ